MDGWKTFRPLSSLSFLPHEYADSLASMPALEERNWHDDDCESALFLPDRHDIKACIATHNPLGWHFSSHEQPPSNVLTRSEYGYDTMDKSTNSMVLYV